MPLKRKDRHGNTVIYGRVKLPNGKVRERRCTTWNAAIAWEETAKLENPDTSLTDTVSLAALFTKYLDHVQARGVAKTTYNWKCRVFRLLLTEMSAHTPVIKVTYSAVEEYLNDIARQQSGKTANRHRRELCAAYRWGIKSMNLPSPCPWTVEAYSEDARKKHVPSVADFWKVYDAADEQRQRLLLAYLHTGARRSEIFRLKWSDVDMQNKRLALSTRKRKGGGMEYDYIPMTDELHAMLTKQRLITGFKEYVFLSQHGRPWRSATKLMGKLCERAGVQPFGFHSIRHLSASILDGKGVPLSVIQAILRHKSAHTTARYLNSLRGVQTSLEGVFSRPKSESASESLSTETHPLILKSL
jgi:integrase